MASRTKQSSSSLLVASLSSLTGNAGGAAVVVIKLTYVSATLVCLFGPVVGRCDRKSAGFDSHVCYSHKLSQNGKMIIFKTHTTFFAFRWALSVLMSPCAATVSAKQVARRALSAVFLSHEMPHRLSCLKLCSISAVSCSLRSYCRPITSMSFSMSLRSSNACFLRQVKYPHNTI